MGYCFDYRHRLCCDSCGVAGGVRKRRCAYKVSGIPYCPAPALCGPCYKKHGGLRGVHGDACRDGAAAAQAQDDADAARAASGDLKVRTAWGDWHDAVPAGKVLVKFDGDVYVLVDADAYKGVRWFLDLADYEPWEGAA